MHIYRYIKLLNVFYIKTTDTDIKLKKLSTIIIYQKYK